MENSELTTFSFEQNDLNQQLISEQTNIKTDDGCFIINKNNDLSEIFLNEDFINITKENFNEEGFDREALTYYNPEIFKMLISDSSKALIEFIDIDIKNSQLLINFFKENLDLYSVFKSNYYKILEKIKDVFNASKITLEYDEVIYFIVRQSDYEENFMEKAEQINLNIIDSIPDSIDFIHITTDFVRI